ncbi:YncE family protein [Acidiluteibacter ferrifornacis]|uniref:T9SS type A sorting domain-containing protein n=1 Tax=Acidiluteibacter ferrifornacis TaxID=2692424 RepID=A0A6N9NLC9_9FLAO|nr:T9SS type A sorting domain-containing protein [Acidiluteibacter ferrifornacis]NBG65385.1 T9SS type A sorting domain-containing protein [Acidiluteibacter ferrifornacis]
MRLLLLLIFATIFSSTHAQEFLFFGSQQTGSIYKVDLSNNNIKAIDSGVVHIRRFSVDTLNKKIYWAAGSQNKIVRSDYSGANKQDVLLNASDINNLKVDPINGKIYYSIIGNSSIRVCSLNGLNSQILISPVNNVQGIAVDASRNAIYWTEYNNGDIKKARLDGSNVTTIFNSNDIIFDLDINPLNGLLYFTNRTGDLIQSIDTTGGNLQTIISAGARLGTVKVSAQSNQLFWVTNGTNRSQVSMSDLTGNNIQTIIDTTTFVISGMDISEAPTLVGVSNVNYAYETSLFPVPFSEELFVTFKDPIDKNVIVSLFDISGREVFSQKKNIHNQTQLERGDLMSGIYLIRIIDEETKEVIMAKKVMVK